MLQSARLRLQVWAERHRKPFAEMHSDHEVMLDLGGPFDRAKSNEKFERYSLAWRISGTSRWVIEDRDGNFMGYAGVFFRPDPDHPLGAHHEIGWRLCRRAWGKGYASEGARMALRHAWETLEIDEILSYTSPDNVRSQRVMERLTLKRMPALDFSAVYDEDFGPWQGLVWKAERRVSGAQI